MPPVHFSLPLDVLLALFSGGWPPVCCWSSFLGFLCCPRNQVLGAWAWLVPLAVTLSTFGSVNGIFFGGSRVCYVAAREGHMVRDGVPAGRGGGAAGGHWKDCRG